MKYFKYILISILGLSSCGGKKVDCYTMLIGDVKKENRHTPVISASRQISTLQNRDGRPVMKDSSYARSSLFDEVVFFNKRQDKCLLLLLQKTTKDLKLDQVRIIQGTLTGNKWNFATDRLPDIPETIFTVDKPVIDGKLVNNEFTVLAGKGREFVLKAGSPRREDCQLDERYWFGD